VASPFGSAAVRAHARDHPHEEKDSTGSTRTDPHTQRFLEFRGVKEPSNGVQIGLPLLPSPYNLANDERHPREGPLRGRPDAVLVWPVTALCASQSAGLICLKRNGQRRWLAAPLSTFLAPTHGRLSELCRAVRGVTSARSKWEMAGQGGCHGR